jgi:NarL family two-component system response regulator LiaR
MKDLIRVLVVEDHAVVREGLCVLISAWPDMEVVGQAGDGIEAVLQAGRLRPDVILMDLVMPRKDGIAATAEIKAENPAARVLVLTSFAQDKNVYQAIKAGATGYLLKDTSSRELVQAIRSVHRGEFSLQPTIALKVVRELSRASSSPETGSALTEREVKVLELLARGLSNQEIAQELCISKHTVNTHVSNILSKLHLASRTQAALYAIKKGLVSTEPE